ncbi:hypothetical protein P8452_32568 [Trifolium repens]|nr:hypothetical protein P8452_32568 [Trifolium repens]
MLISEGIWHRSFRGQDIRFRLLKALSSINGSPHITSDPKRTVLTTPCMWNGSKRPCYLFARKFYPDALDKLMCLFSNYCFLKYFQFLIMIMILIA